MIVLTADDWDTPPVKPLPVGVDQVYNVPDGITPLVPFTGVTLNGPPLHTVVVIVLTVASGLIVTVTVKTTPAQLPDNGVTI